MTLLDICLQPTLDAARRLLGALVLRDTVEGRLVGRIVETEAYLADDPACHGVRTLPDGQRLHRQTNRNAVMFGPPARAYVYFTYGNHYLLNVVTQPAGVPEAVLIRALEPVEGITLMARNRGLDDPRQLTNGPGKLTQAFAIDAAFNGHDLMQPPLQVQLHAPVPDEDIVATTRIGIRQAADRPWRFYLRGNAWVSRR